MNERSMRSFGIAVLLTICFVMCSVAQVSTIKIGVSNQKPAVGEPFVFEINLENSPSQSVIPPDITEFEILSGPSQSSSISIINGQKKSSFSLKYTLAPKRKGTFVLGPAYMMNRGIKEPSNSINIQVVENRQNQTTFEQSMGSKEIIIKLESPKSTYYLGEQIPLTLKLYHQIDISSYRITALPEIKGATFLKLENVNNGEPVIKNIGGKRYVVQDLQRFNAYAHTSGKLNISSMEASFEKGDRYGGFFSSGENIYAKTNPLSIEIKELPTPAPQNFSGAVGIYTSKVQFKSYEASVGEGLEIVISVVGNGLPTMTIPKEWPKTDIYEAYGPTDIQDQNTEEISGIVNTKIFKYTIVPKLDTTIVLKPSFVYFDTDKNQYFDAIQDSTNVRFKKGNPKAPVVLENQPDSYVQNFIRRKGALFGLLLSISLYGLWVFRRTNNEKKLPISTSDPTLSSHRENQIDLPVTTDIQSETRPDDNDLNRYKPTPSITEHKENKSITPPFEILNLESNVENASKTPHDNGEPSSIDFQMILKNEIQRTLNIKAEEQTRESVIDLMQLRSVDTSIIAEYKDIVHKIDAHKYAGLLIKDPGVFVQRIKDWADTTITN